MKNEKKKCKIDIQLVIDHNVILFYIVQNLKMKNCRHNKICKRVNSQIDFLAFEIVEGIVP